MGFGGKDRAYVGEGVQEADGAACVGDLEGEVSGVEWNGGQWRGGVEWRGQWDVRSA